MTGNVRISAEAVSELECHILMWWFSNYSFSFLFLGLSKSLGLIEGYGGRGKGGLPATLSPAEEEKAKGPHEKYGYNSYLSEKISLDRSIPDYRPTK